MSTTEDSISRFPGSAVRCRCAMIGSVLGLLSIVVSAQMSSQVIGDDEVQAVINNFEQTAAEDVERDGIGGLAWGIVEGDELLWANGLGWSNWELRRPARAGTVFPVGSFTSAMTITMLLQLAEQGVVGLDDRAVRYIPELAQMYGPPGYANSISLRHLATHTGGLMHSPPLPYSVPGSGEDWQSRIVELIPSTPLYYVPGEMYYYSGVGLGLLALAVTRAAEYPFDELAEVLIFEPLGMMMSGFELTPMMEDALAVGRVDARRMPITPVLPSEVPRRETASIRDAGAYTTVEDLASFLGSLLGASRYQILTSAGSSAIRELGLQDGRGNAAGLFIQRPQFGDRLVGQGRTTSGHTAFIALDLETAIGVILLKSYDNGGDHLEQAVSTALEQLLGGGVFAGGTAGGEGGVARSGAIPFAEVEVRPVRRSCGRLVYPAELSDAPSGDVPDPARVTLEFVIGTDGAIAAEDVVVIASPDERFNAAAVDWALSCTFTPGREQGRPVPVLVRQMLNFSRPN